MALGAKEAGAVVDLWKVAGERRVIAIVNMDGPDTLDRVLFDLPIMTRMGQHVQIKVSALRRYEEFAADVKARLKARMHRGPAIRRAFHAPFTSQSRSGYGGCIGRPSKPIRE